MIYSPSSASIHTPHRFEHVFSLPLLLSSLSPEGRKAFPFPDAFLQQTRPEEVRVECPGHSQDRE